MNFVASRTYPRIDDATFKDALWTLKQKLALNSMKLLRFVNIVSIANSVDADDWTAEWPSCIIALNDVGVIEIYVDFQEKKGYEITTTTWVLTDILTLRAPALHSYENRPARMRLEFHI